MVTMISNYVTNLKSLGANRVFKAIDKKCKFSMWHKGRFNMTVRFHTFSYTIKSVH